MLYICKISAKKFKCEIYFSKAKLPLSVKFTANLLPASFVGRKKYPVKTFFNTVGDVSLPLEKSNFFHQNVTKKTWQL